MFNMMKVVIVILVLSLGFDVYAEEEVNNILGYEIISSKIIKTGPPEVESRYVSNSFIPSSPGKIYTEIIRPVLADFVLRCTTSRQTYAVRFEISQFKNKWGEWVFDAKDIRVAISRSNLPDCN